MSADGSTSLVESPRSAGLGSVRVVQDTVPVLDTARFEHMQRIATVMAATSLIPDTLKGSTQQQTLANCFLVVNQATRWGLDPFAVAQCCSVVHGKLTYEGKLVAAVIEAKLGVRLTYAWSGEGERMSVTVSGVMPDGVTESIEGTVTDWRTDGKNSPWRPATYKKMLAYRGNREWARLYAPAVMLGVYSDDEMEALERKPMRELNPLPPAAPPAPPPAIRHHLIEATVATPAPAAPPKAPPSPPPAPRPSVGASVAHTATAPSAPEAPTQEAPEPPIDGAALLAHIADELGACGDLETLDDTWTAIAELMDRMTRRDREEAAGLYDAAEARIKGAKP
jgi:hypothetical protein